MSDFSKLRELVGIVKKIASRKNDITFDIEAHFENNCKKDKLENITCRYASEIPIKNKTPLRITDRVIIKGVFEKEIFVLYNEPVIFMNKDSTVYMMDFFLKKGLSSYSLEFFIKEAKSYFPVIEEEDKDIFYFFSQMAERNIEDRSIDIIKFISSSKFFEMDYFNDDQQKRINFVNSFFVWWKTEMLRRPLRLLGITDEEIEETSFIVPLLDAHKICMNNPLRIPSIKYDTAIWIFDNYVDREPTVLEQICGKVCRNIYEALMISKWTSVSSDSVQLAIRKEICNIKKNSIEFNQQISDFDKITEICINSYFCRKWKNSMYINYPFMVEEKLCRFFTRLLENQKKVDVTKKQTKHIEPFFTNLDCSEEQKEAISVALNENVTIITGGSGTGKCFGKETNVLMYDGSIKNIIEIKILDMVMGYDHKPQLVKSVTSGRDIMYIVKSRYYNFTCNGVHLLTLLNKNGEILEMKVIDFLKLSYEESLDYRLFTKKIDLQMPDNIRKKYKKHLEIVEDEKMLFSLGKMFASYNDLDDKKPIVKHIKREALNMTFLMRFFNFNLKRSFKDGMFYIISSFSKNMTIYQLDIPQCLFNNIIFILRSIGVNIFQYDSKLYVDTNSLYENNSPYSSVCNLHIIENNADDYYGMELDGHGRFYLDNLCIVHNSSIIQEIVENIRSLGSKYICTSFTGKAVSRVRKIFKGKYRETIMTMDRAIFKSYEEMSLTNTLIIDEISMVTSELLYRLLKKYPFIKNFVGVGDVNQLPPIGWGCLLVQLMKSEVVPIIKLTKNFRSVKGINRVANDCIAPSKEKKYIEWDDDGIYQINGDITLVDDIIDLKMEEGVDVLNELTYICPFKEHLAEVNNKFQDKIFKDKPFVTIDNRRWFEKDRVMMTDNNKEIDVMNGEEGFVKSIYDNCIEINFEDRIFVFAPREYIYDEENPSKRKYDLQSKIRVNAILKEEALKNGDLSSYKPIPVYPIEDIVHCYAMTTHKAEGSEYRFIIAHFPRKSRFIDNNMIYTTITRGKEEVIILASKDTLNYCVNNYASYREDNLALRINPDLYIEKQEIFESDNESSAGDEDQIDYDDF